MQDSETPGTYSQKVEVTVFSYLKRDQRIPISEKDMTIFQISEGRDIAQNGWILLKWELVSAKGIKEEFLGETLTLRVQGRGTFWDVICSKSVIEGGLHLVI